MWTILKGSEETSSPPRSKRLSFPLSKKKKFSRSIWIQQRRIITSIMSKGQDFRTWLNFIKRESILNSKRFILSSIRIWKIIIKGSSKTSRRRLFRKLRVFMKRISERKNSNSNYKNSNGGLYNLNRIEMELGVLLKREWKPYQPSQPLPKSNRLSLALQKSLLPAIIFSKNYKVLTIRNSLKSQKESGVSARSGSQNHRKNQRKSRRRVL